MGTFISTAPIPSNCEYITKTTLAATNQYINVTGLSGTKFLVFFKLKNASAADKEIYLEVNGDTTATNYYTQLLSADNAVVAGTRVNSAYVGKILNASHQSGFMILTISPDNYLTAQNTFCKAVSSSVAINGSTIINDTTAMSSITQIRLKHTDANGFAIGSEVSVYEFNEG